MNLFMNQKSITVEVNGKDIVVEKLPLRKIAEVFKVLQDLPKIFNERFADQDLSKIPNDQIVAMLPSIIGDALPEVAKLIAVATPLEENEVLDELGLNEAIELLVAIFQVNDFSKVVDNVKKLTARRPVDENKK
jgi:hypothetical protein